MFLIRILNCKSDVGNYDRFVIQDLIKEVAQTQQVDAAAAKRFKVIVLNEADSLSRDAQQALRRTMEKYMGNIRVILCCKSTSKIMSPIRSRCLLVRVSAPSHNKIVDILGKVASKENARVSDAYIDAVAKKSGGNLRKALLMLETACVQGIANGPVKDIPTTDWEDYIKDTAKMMIQEQTPGCVLKVRARLYELLTKCIPADIILKTLAFDIVPMVDGVLKPEVMHLASFYEQRTRHGSKPIYHLEAFVVRFQAMYKRWLIETLG
jgi:replication factor C subunit 3/5